MDKNKLIYEGIRVTFLEVAFISFYGENFWGFKAMRTNLLVLCFVLSVIYTYMCIFIYIYYFLICLNKMQYFFINKNCRMQIRYICITICVSRILAEFHIICNAFSSILIYRLEISLEQYSHKLSYC